MFTAKPCSGFFFRVFLRFLFIAIFFLFASSSVRAGGITVPDGSRLDIGSGTLNLELDGDSGDINNQGTITTTTGTIRLNGNWTGGGNGAYSGGTGSTVVFTSASDKIYTLSDVQDSFFHFQHTGTGTITMSASNPANDAVDINGTFLNSAGTFATGNVDMDVAGDWNNYDKDFFTVGTSVVTLNGVDVDQSIYGETIFYDLTKDLSGNSAGADLTFESSSTQRVQHALTLQGLADAPGQYLNIRSSVGGAEAGLLLLDGGSQSIRYVDVQDNDASSAVPGEEVVTLIARESPDHSAGYNVTNWLFNTNITVTWDGSDDTDWDNPYNWDLGLVPEAGDNVVIPAAPANQPDLVSISAGSVEVQDMDIQAGASLALSGKDLDVTGTMTLNGTLSMAGNERVDIANPIAGNSTVKFVGQANGSLTGAVITQRIFINGTALAQFYNLTIDDRGQSMHSTFTTDANVTVTNDLVISADNDNERTTFSTGSGLTLAVSNDLVISSDGGSTAAIFTPAGAVTVGNDIAMSSAGASSAASFTPAVSVSVTGDVNLSGGTLTLPADTVTLSIGGGLNVSGGTLDAADGNIDAEDVDISGGELQAPTASTSFTVSGDFTRSAGTFTPGDGTVVFDGTSGVGAHEQTITGDTTFWGLKKDVTADIAQTHTLTFAAGSETTVQYYLTLKAQDGSPQLQLRSSASPAVAYLTLLAGGGQDIRNVDVMDNSAANGLMLVGRGTSVKSNAANWEVGGVTLNWTGRQSTDWSDWRNWDKGLVPIAGDIAEINNGTYSGSSVDYQPILVADVSLLDLTLNPSTSVDETTLTLNGHGLTVTGTLSNEGNVIVKGPDAVSIDTLDIDSGTFTYTGDNSGAAATITSGVRPSSFYNLVFKDTNAADTFDIDVDLSIYGDLTLDATNQASVDFSSNTVALDGSFDIEGGTFTAPASAEAFTVGGDWINGGGTFDANGGAVTLAADSVTQTFTGDTTFYDLVKNIPADPAQEYALVFTAGSTQTVAHLLTLQGDSNAIVKRLALRSTVSGGPAAGREWALSLVSGAAQNIRYVDVSDSNASGGIWLVGRDSNDGGDNTRWIFDTPTVTWDGSASTDWEDPYNWDLGFVPFTGDDVVVATAANQPILTADTAPGTLTLNTSTTITLDGNGLTVPGAFSNDGNVILKGTEAVDITTPDTTSGTFTYIGDGLGADIVFTNGTRPTAFYDLVFKDTNASDTFAPDTDVAVYGDMRLDSVNASGVDFGTASLDVDGSFVLEAGTFTAPGAGETFTVGADWTGQTPNSGFVHNNGRVTLNTTTASTVSGNTTFYDLYATTPSGKTITFTAGSVQTVVNDFNFLGNRDDRMVLRSSQDGDKWTLNINKGYQTEGYLDLKDSIAVVAGSPDYLLALNSVDQKDGNGDSTNTGWSFSNLRLLAPLDGKTTGTNPVLIGQGVPDNHVEIKDINSDIVATALADANGNFRVLLGQDGASLGTVTNTVLDLGVNRLVPVYDAIEGSPNGVTVVDSPITAQVPVITSPAHNERINTNLPTIEGQGKAGAAVQVVAKDAAGNLLLTLPPNDYAGEGTVDGTGAFSVTLTTALPRDINYVSVVVDGVSSPIFTYILNDIHGVVFDSASNNLLAESKVYLYTSAGTLAEPGTDINASDTNPFITSSDGHFAFLTNTGTFYLVVEQYGYDYPTTLSDAELPSGRSIQTGSRGEPFTITTADAKLDQPMDANQYLFKIVKDANKSEAKIGEVVTYTVTMESMTGSNTVINPKLNDVIPPGFKYMSGRVLLDGQPIADPAGNRPLVFAPGNFTPRQMKTIRYQTVIGAGVVPGEYENIAFMKYDNGTVISNHAGKVVKVMIDPLFDAGAVFGKVFYDWNDNGRQDEPDYIFEDRENIEEGPVPNVKIVMEDGTIVTADKNGQFHIPGLIPGRHLLRVDERTLPKGAYCTTEKVQVIDVTAGSITKLNFGVNIDNTQVVGKDVRFFEQNMSVEQTADQVQPRLNVDMFHKDVPFYNDVVIEPIEFRIFMNYAPFIQSWRLDVIDRDTKRVVQDFAGTRYNVYQPIIWDGRDKKGRYIRSDRNYAFILKVEDDKGAWDETEERPIALKVLGEEEMKVREREKTEDEIREEVKARSKEYREWLLSQSQKSVLARQTIWIKGETVRIDPEDTDVRQIRILKGGELFMDVPLLAREKFTARDLLEGAKDKGDVIEMVVPNGDYELEVVAGEGPSPYEAGAVGQTVVAGGEEVSVPSAAGASETITQVAHYKRPLKVGEDYLMFVAMGDGKVGYNVNRGNIESVRGDDRYLPGFYQEGKLVYYLKGKVKGKYIITSSFDTERKTKKAFRGIDDEQYYPVYGDSSQVNYDATDTQGNLYLLVEWDKSRAVWGNYAVDFNNTEFAKYSRNLYGGKVDYTSVASTEYGDPKTHVVVFHAVVRQRAAHNEFLGTGGSLYYLKDRDIVPGTAEVKLQVRDAITGEVKSTTEMAENSDFDIDYSEGRILFWQPVSMAADSGQIISNGLLQGDPVYVVVDYQYHLKDAVMDATHGARVAEAVTDNVVVGGTYVKEVQAAGEYELKGQDVTVHLGKDTTVKAEYAETLAQESASFVSTDGGITFSQLAVGAATSGKAYGISQDSRLFDRLGLKSYYKWIENNYVTASTSSQQGKEMKGLALTFDLTPVTRLTARHDVQRLIEQGNLQTTMQVGAKETQTTILQFVHDARRLRLTGEYRRQEVSDKSDQYESETNQAQDTIAVQAEYDLNDKTKLTFKQQMDASGKARDAQATTEISRRLTDKLTVDVQESFGSQGSATKIGATANVTPKLVVGTDYTLAKARGGAPSSTTAMRIRGQITDNASVETSYSMTRQETGARTDTMAVTAGAKVDGTSIKAGVQVANDGVNRPTQGIVVDASRSDKEGRQTTTKVEIQDSVTEGKKTAVTFSDKGVMGSGAALVSERSYGYGRGSYDKADTYKVTGVRDGRNIETVYTRRYAENQTERSVSNIFGLTGDINDRFAADLRMERGRVQNIDGSQVDRTVISTGLGYVEKDEDGKEKLKSSTKVELRLDKGTEDKQQFVFAHTAEGKPTDEMTLLEKFNYSQTWNRDTKKAEAQYKEIMLGMAYRPITADRLNIFGQYTYKENQKPSGQSDVSDVEKNAMHVLEVAGAYDFTDQWQIVERLAYRIMEEKVTGFEFTRTHTWLLVNRANYRVNQDWKIGAEYRILTQKEAKDQRRGFLTEAVRSVNDNMELGIGYNFTDFVDDLTDLSFTVQGPFIRMTGKLYDRTPEERARAREKWLEKRISRYAWAMVNDELEKPDSPVLAEFNDMYAAAKAAQEQGKYEESKRIYKGLLLATQMMYEEAAQFVRQHVKFEEKLFDAYERAQEYFDKGEIWMARKLWEKIVEEAQKAMVE